MRFAIAAAVVIAAFCFGEGTETQTDWSGGAGTPGPVTTFGTTFDYCSGIDDTVTGEISVTGEHILDLASDGARWADCDDLDGDGDMDMLVGEYSSDSLVWYENLDGMASLWEKHGIAYGDGPSRVAIADIDGDMDLDAVCGYYSGDLVAWYENDGTGGTWTQHDIDINVDASRGIVPRDVDDDGDIDIFGAAYSDDYVCWWENDGTGTVWAKDTIGLCNGPRLEDAIDLDYDGDLDICVGCYSADSLLWYENNGVGSDWTRHTISGSFNGSRGGWFNDFNGDSYIDVVAPCATGDSLCWFENADMSGTSWTRHTIDIYDNPWMCNTADIDDDGDSDVLLCGTTEDITYWYENDGSGNWTRHLIVDKYTGSMFAGAFDIDEDMVMEVVVTDSYSDVVAYYDVNDVEGILVSSVLDAQEDAEWGTIDWTATLSSTSEILFAVRSSEDSADMGEWSSAISVPGTALSAYTTEGDDFIQYAAIVLAEDLAGIPVLEDVTINWDFVSIEDTQEALGSYGLSIVSGNPSTAAVLGFTIPQAATVDLSVFDVSGRIVDSVTSDNLEAGSYQVTMRRLVPGTYFVRMNSGEFTATEKIVLIR